MLNKAHGRLRFFFDKSPSYLNVMFYLRISTEKLFHLTLFEKDFSTRYSD